MRTTMLKVAATLAGATLLVSGCAAGSSGGTGSGGTTSGGTTPDGSGADRPPIVVGAVAMLSGPSTFDDVPDAVRAVFDRVNENGGIDGRMIRYEVRDDQADPAKAAAAAKTLVEDENVVAMVGSSSLMECQVNATYYEAMGVASLEGVATAPACFDSPVIAPVTAGPFVGTQLSLTFGSESLGLDRICAVIENRGATKPAYRAAIDRWSSATGEKLAYLDDSLTYGLADFTPYVVSAMQQDCDGVFLGLVAPDALALLKAANAQGWTDVPFLSLTTVYTESFAKAASGMVGQGLSVAAEFMPFTDANAPATEDWRRLMTSAGVPLSSFSQAGYAAATIFVHALRQVPGEITRASVLETLRSMDPVDLSMMGNPWSFGNNPNHSGWPVTLAPGSMEWEKAAEGWIHVDVG